MAATVTTNKTNNTIGITIKAGGGGIGIAPTLISKVSILLVISDKRDVWFGCGLLVPPAEMDADSAPVVSLFAPPADADSLVDSSVTALFVPPNSIAAENHLVRFQERQSQ